MNLRQIRLTIFVLALMILSVGVGYWWGQHRLTIETEKRRPKITIERKVPSGKEDVNFALFWEAWDRLEASYLDRTALDQAKMVYGAIAGMTASLGDPYTVFLSPSDQKLSKDDLAGEFEGVGIQLGYKDAKLAVIAPLSGTPAEKAGVKAADLIIKIRDEKKGVDKETTSMSLPEAVNYIRGPKGTAVTLTLVREGTAEPFEVRLMRENIIVKSVELTFKDKVAYLKLSRFGDRTYQEWEEAIEKIENEKAKTKSEFKGVIFDLRNNPGGYLQGAVFIASEFLSDGVVVKQEKSRNGGTETFSVNRRGKLSDVPLVVLINQGSASASEIVAGVLHERGRAKLVGEKTFGKGTIQEAEELSGGSGLHVTIARWLLPSGLSIDKEGIKPDFEVKMEEKDQTKDPQFEKAIEVLLKSQ